MKKLSELSIVDLETLRKWMTGEFGSKISLRTSCVYLIEKEIEKRMGEIDFEQ